VVYVVAVAMLAPRCGLAERPLAGYLASRSPVGSPPDTPLRLGAARERRDAPRSARLLRVAACAGRSQGGAQQGSRPPRGHSLPWGGGELRLRGGAGADGAGSSDVIPSEWTIRSALSAAGPVAKSVPPALLRAVRDGRVGLEVVARFVEWHQRLPRCLRWVLQVETFRQRILADDGFIVKLIIEATLACTVQAVAEVQHRGDNLGKELDFALGGIVAVMYSSAVSTVLTAPVAVPRKARKRESRWDAFIRTCPSSVFQEGPPPYSMLQRVAALLYHIPRLFVTGFSASFVAYVYITILLLVRHAISKVIVGGKWRRKPKTLHELKQTLAASEPDGSTLQARQPQYRYSGYGAADVGSSTHALQSGDRQDLLDEVGLGALSQVGLAAIGIDPASLPPSAHATSWLNAPPAPAWVGAGPGALSLPAGRTRAAPTHTLTTSPYCRQPSAEGPTSLAGAPRAPPTAGRTALPGVIPPYRPRQGEGRSDGAAADGKSWEMKKVEVVRPMRVRSRSFNDVSHLIQMEEGESPQDGEAAGAVTAAAAPSPPADVCAALSPRGEIECPPPADKALPAGGPAGELASQRAGEEALTTPAAAPRAVSRSRSPLPQILRDTLTSVKSAVGGRLRARSDGRRRLSSPPIASPMQSLTRSSTMLADAISTGRQPVLRRLPGAPKVLFRGGKYGLALSLMIEGPSMLRPSPSLVFLPPQAGKGEGIGLIPWAEVINVSLLCGLYVALFSNLRGHIVVGIEMRILDKVLVGANQAWRPLGSLLLRTLNLYIGAICLLMGLELFSSNQDSEPPPLDLDWNTSQRPTQPLGAAAAEEWGVNTYQYTTGAAQIADVRSGTLAGKMRGGVESGALGAWTWTVREEKAPGT